MAPKILFLYLYLYLYADLLPSPIIKNTVLGNTT